MSKIEIKKVTIEDIKQLQKISQLTFTETFAQENTKENLDKYLEESFSETKLRRELTNPNSEFYFALFDNSAIGYIKINHGEAQTEIKDSKAIEIERIYVIVKFHGNTVGQTLFNKAYEIAKQKRAHYIWLGVWEENHKALHFYKKNNFVAFGKHVFMLGNDAQNDLLLKLELDKK